MHGHMIPASTMPNVTSVVTIVVHEMTVDSSKSKLRDVSLLDFIKDIQSSVMLPCADETMDDLVEAHHFGFKALREACSSTPEGSCG